MAKTELEKLTQEVSEISTVVDSAIALIEGLAAKIRENAGDAAAMIDLANALDAKASQLADAVEANTETPPPEEEEIPPG